MINYKCENCEVNFSITKKDLKKYPFGKKGETFIVVKRRKQELRLFNNKSVFYDIKYELLKDLKFKGVKCPICKEINWFVDELIVNPSSLKEDGWYILKYAKKLIKVKEVGRKINIFKIFRFEAKQYANEDITNKVLCEKSVDPMVSEGGGK